MLDKVFPSPINTGIHQDEDSQVVNVYFGSGIVSIDLSDLTLTSSPVDSCQHSGKYCSSLEICHSPIPVMNIDDADEADISSILHDSEILAGVLDDSWICSSQEASDNGHSAETSHRLESAFAQLDAICDWLQNEPTFYELQQLRVSTQSHMKHHIYAKCSMSSLPHNMCDSESNINEQLESCSHHMKERSQKAQPAQSRKSSRKNYKSLSQAVRNTLKKFRRVFRK